MAHIQYEPLVGPVLDGPSIPPPVLSWAPSYPEQLHPPDDLLDHPALSWVGGLPNLAIPDSSWQGVYPDWLPPIPQQDGFFAQNIDPIREAAPELSWHPTYQDFLLRTPQQEGDFGQNIDPIPEPVPDLAQVTYPELLLPDPPPHPPSTFFLDNPNLHRVYDDVSRGLHVGDIRGFHQTLESAHCEPWAAAVTENAQTFSHNTLTLINITGAASRSGFGPGTDLDPWDMVDAANDRIVFSHDGYYLVSFGGTLNGTTGTKLARVVYYVPSGVAQRTVFQDVRPATSGSGLMCTSDIQPFAKGGWIQAFVSQTSGGPATGGPSFLSVVRVARPRIILPQ